MRFMLTILAAIAAGGHAFARDEPMEIELSTAALSKAVSGTTTRDATTSYIYKAQDVRDITVTVDGESGICGFEVQRSSSRGFEPDFQHLPASRSFKAQAGETFTFSFFQTRKAFMDRKLCTYTLSLQ